MTLYPEVQKKAQAELDAVVGPNRLPTFQDRPNLPYMNAVAMEALRWHSVAPTCKFPFLPAALSIRLYRFPAVPHRTTEDQFYKGYFIPKGTLFITNIW